MKIKKNLTQKEYYDYLYKIAFTQTFLNVVKNRYKLKSIAEALSMIKSNDLRNIVEFISDYYFKKYGKKEREKLKTPVKKRESLDKWREEHKEEYLEKQRGYTNKYFYKSKEHEEVIENFKTRMSYMNFRVEEIESFVDLKNIPKNKIERILVVLR